MILAVYDRGERSSIRYWSLSERDGKLKCRYWSNSGRWGSVWYPTEMRHWTGKHSCEEVTLQWIMEGRL